MLKRIPFIRIISAYAAGIIIARNIFKIDIVYIMVILILLITIILYLNIKDSNYNFIALTLTLLLILTGIYRYHFYNSKPTFPIGSSYIATVFEYPVEKTKSYKIESLLTTVYSNDSGKNIQEKLIIYFKPDSLAKALMPGNQIIFNTDPSIITNRGNPEEFDYQKYMANQKIFRQVYLSPEKWTKHDNISHFSLRVFSEKIRFKLLNIYKNNNITDEKFAILSALTLGYKDALDPETKQIYASAGAMHVLAVSGLHVGIIYLAINLLVGFLRKSKRGKLLFILLAIHILWFYAVITGMSPSVLRATVMFSFLIIGENLRRPTNIYNTIALSAFILLFFNPNLIFEIGFQLSYSAVVGIIFFQPKINNLINFKIRFLKWAWALFSVSIAAQLATFPLSLYYFHQFPTYFWLSNFIVIPGAFILIFFGIAILITSPIPVISTLLGEITSYILEISYFLLQKLQVLPAAVIQNIHISTIQFTFLITALIILMLFLSLKKTKYLFLLISVLIVIFSLNILHKSQCLKQSKIIIYNAQEGALIHLICGLKNYVLYENKIQLNSFDFSITENTKTKQHLFKSKIIKLDSIYEDNVILLNKPFISFKNKSIWIQQANKSISPDIDVDLIVTKYSIPNKKNNQSSIIQTSNYYPNNEITPGVFYLKKEGAFIYNF
ncbi:MAG: ComEC/Rec2 family competence protein [Mariniphaga sp.]|nr:ComEC/Rec2 family competence protein [Mariniphaga sp.]